MKYSRHRRVCGLPLRLAVTTGEFHEAVTNRCRNSELLLRDQQLPEEPARIHVTPHLDDLVLHRHCVVILSSSLSDVVAFCSALA